MSKYTFSIIRNCLCFILLTCSFRALAVDEHSYISLKPISKGFRIAENGTTAAMLISSNDFRGVYHAGVSFQADLKEVTGTLPELIRDSANLPSELMIIGTIGKNEFIDKLIKSGKLDVSKITGKWETSVTQVIEQPFKGVKRALVIAGSDKRGTIYGIYALSAQIGVSPWYWWADVPVPKQKTLYAIPEPQIIDEPAVKYRGIFLNDEAPALSGWSRAKFGGFNHRFYTKVFELLLRLKGNYLWPAMWGNAFNDDDKMNPVLADEYGIVMGTSHHEPMLRAQQEWKLYGKGSWNYDENEAGLKEFWKQGMVNKGEHESIITIGMRGDGDLPMAENSNKELLERIVKDQRKIISEVTGKPANETPQLWALYKEVQDYYDQGMRVPDDVTLLLCDDNWGNIRKLPKLGDKPRTGGYGIYYHFDYVGGPRNYKWLNTNSIKKVWEQMHLASEYGADKIWIVNVGDLKPMEFPIEFFLDYAWRPEKWPAAKLDAYTRLWAGKQFGPQFESRVATMLDTYTRYNSRRKPELLSPDTYSLVNYREFESVVNDYNNLLKQAESVKEQLPENYRDAYYQLVLHPIKACANLNELYYTVALNRLYAKQGRVETAQLAARAKALFAKDAAISNEYNKIIAGGKWNHMMDQVHIGYTSWNNPPKDVMPEVFEPTNIPETGILGLTLEGSGIARRPMDTTGSLPQFNRYQQKHYIELFNTGQQSLDYAITTDKSWLTLSQKTGKVSNTLCIEISANWEAVPIGRNKVLIKVQGKNESYLIPAEFNKLDQSIEGQHLFLPSGSALAWEASNFTREINDNHIKWLTIPGYGHTGSAVTSTPGKIKPSEQLNETSPRLEYDLFLQEPGEVRFSALIAPSLDFTGGKGLRYAISVDNEKPQVVTLKHGATENEWSKAVADNMVRSVTRHKIKTKGKHTLKLWRVDPGVVIHKLVAADHELPPSYLGPPAIKNK